jgi:hypothetical protein
MDYSKEELTPICQRIFEEAKLRLPDELGERLTCSQAVRNHGSYRTVLLFNVWDKYQSDVLPKQHFCYCLGYDPKQLISGGTDWYFHLWLNTIRMYRNRTAIKAELESKLCNACPKGFQFLADNRAVQAKINFDSPKSVEKLVEFLVPKYVALIQAVHPILMPIIDGCSIYGRAEVKKAVDERGRLSFQPVRTAHPELIEEYSRSIPPSWRPEILAKYDHKCAHCGKDLSSGDFHMDHIKPFTKEGKRVKANFQPLCAACNLKKGNRFIG